MKKNYKEGEKFYVILVISPFLLLNFQMVKEIKGFKVINLQIPSSSNLKETSHEIYVKPHTTRDMDGEDTTSLFIVNLPPLPNLKSMKSLFSQINSGAIIKGYYGREIYNPTGGCQWDMFINLSKLSSKEFGTDLSDTAKLPIGCGVVTFIDRDSLDLILSSINKQRNIIIWESNEVVGSMRYNGQSKIHDPVRLEEEVSSALLEFQEREVEAKNEVQNLREIVDEDGFTLVVGKQRKTKSEVLGVVKLLDELKNSEELKQKTEEKHKLDFYRFQVRERKKQEMSELLSKFKDDQERVKQMRQKRKFRPY